MELVTPRAQRLDQPAVVANGRKRSGARLLHSCCPVVAPKRNRRAGQASSTT
jgi:hypothetical protein